MKVNCLFTNNQRAKMKVDKGLSAYRNTISIVGRGKGIHMVY